MNDKRSDASRLGDHTGHHDRIRNSKNSLASDDELDASQLAAMDELMRAGRAGALSDDETQHMATMIRLATSHPRGDAFPTPRGPRS